MPNPDPQTVGYVGDRTDPTPLANYTLAGVNANAPVPETRFQRARPPIALVSSDPMKDGYVGEKPAPGAV